MTLYSYLHFIKTAACLRRVYACLVVVPIWSIGLHQCLADPEASRISCGGVTPRAILPGARGFGTSTTAGSGRHLTPPRASVFIVTSLADSGPGTLRTCAEASVPRTCLFQVGGTIKLSKQIRITHPYLTIAGQTAPDPGVTLVDAGITVATHDVLITHISVRPGDVPYGATPSERDGISIGAKPPNAAYNVVIDHVSLTWAIDENISTAYPTTRDVTISHSLIAEGLHHSIHPKGPHSKGLMVGDGSRNITITRNLLAFNEERNPYIKPGSSVEFINNVVYGWGAGGGWSLCNITNNTSTDAPIELTFVGNIYRAGPNSARVQPLYAKNISSKSRVFAQDNIGPAEATVSHSPEKTGRVAASIPQTSSPPVASDLTEILPSSKVWSAVISSVGARPRSRNAPDKNILTEVTTGTGAIKDCTVGCAHAVGTADDGRRGWRPLDIPARPLEDSDCDGYTNLEQWLHHLASLVE